jgi:low temperature requirement protein LtrA
VWAVSLLVSEPARQLLWAIGLLVELATPIVVGYFDRHHGTSQLSHLPERFGLFTLIVLGESFLVTGAVLANVEWVTETILIAVFCFVTVGCLWWLYFDHVDEAVIQRAYRGGPHTWLRVLAWGYGHLVIYAGLAAIAVGVELSIEKADHGSLATGARAALCGGVAIALLAITALLVLSPAMPPMRLVAARLCGFAVILALAAAGTQLDPPMLIGLLTAVLVGLTVLDAMSRETELRGLTPRLSYDAPAIAVAAEES